jgi:hypothetical protein
MAPRTWARPLENPILDDGPSGEAREPIGGRLAFPRFAGCRDGTDLTAAQGAVVDRYFIEQATEEESFRSPNGEWGVGIRVAAAPT